VLSTAVSTVLVISKSTYDMVIEAPKINHQIQIDEFELRVPWGHIACKWWGPKNIRPVICLHGWQDNAGTFDRIIPYLPNHLSYLVIEFPGHGLSSQIPHGMIYTYGIFLYVLLRVIDHFQWKVVSLIGHSLGAMICYMFASSFPDRCDMAVSVDIIKPDTLSKNFELNFIRDDISQIYVADTRNQQKSEPPSYTYNELIRKRSESKLFPMDMESIPFLIYRGARESKSDPNKYYFSCDGRLKVFAIFIPVNVYDDIGKRIVSPFCFIKAKHSLFPESLYTRFIESMRSNPLFELHRVDGGHHVHLENPKTTGYVITKFINKYRPVQGKL